MLQRDSATKADLEDVRGDIAALRLATEAAIADAKASLTRWMVGSMLAVVAAFRFP